MADNKDTKRRSAALLASVTKEMAKPRLAASVGRKITGNIGRNTTKCAKENRNLSSGILQSGGKGGGMSETQWKWQEPYLEAFLDTDPLNLPSRVAAAEKAIFARTAELRSSSDGRVEWQAIADAISGLTILKKEIKSSVVRAERSPENGKTRTRPN